MQTEFAFKQHFVFEPEEWKPCPASSNHEVSSFGRFRNKITLRILHGTIHETGYRHIGFTIDGKITTKLAHRQIAMAFLEKPSPKHVQVNHLNKNRLDNRASNLEWMTPAENMIHSWNGRRKNEGQEIFKIGKI